MTSHRSANGPQAGVTLVELAVVLAIAAVLAAAAAPSMGDFIRGEGRTAAINDLNASLRIARTEAQARRRPVVLCASSDGATCTAGTPDYADGWIVFEDSDGDYAVDVAVGPAIGEPVLRANTPDLNSSASISLRLARAASVSGTGTARNVVSFDRSGRLRVLPGQRDPQAHFVYCDSSGDSGARALYVTFAGRPVLAVDDDNDGNDDYTNTAFNCP